MNQACAAAYFTLAKDIALTIAAAVGAYVALRGLSTWNRQLKGGVEYDLTRRILKETYRLREALQGVRNPMMWSNEMPAPDEATGMTMSKDQARHYGRASAYQARWSKVSDVTNELQTNLLEAEVIWGDTARAKFEGLFKLQRELFSAVHAYLSSCDPDQSEESRAAYQKILSKRRDILYDLSSEEPDEFTKEIIAAIKAIEASLKPHLHH